MAKIHGLLDLGKRGLMINQTALQTTSHNIANRGTEGFSRQRVDVQTSPPVWEGNHRIGTGAMAGGISRTNNPWLEKQIEREGSQLAFAEGRATGLQKIEGVFNEQTIKGLSGSISDFFNSFRELASNPESAVARTVVRDNSVAMINNFQSVDRQVDNLTKELNSQIEAGVGEINQITKEIAKLNEKILSVEITGTNANDERDRRDLLVKRLADKVDINYSEDTKTGTLNITAGKTGILVAGTSYEQLRTGRTADNKIQVLYELSDGGSVVDITDQFKRGGIGGAIDVRDNIVTDIKNHIEVLSYNISNEVNKAHMEGFDRNGQQGQMLFDIPQDGEFVIENLKLNKSIQDDASLIAAAAKPNSVGDNTTANVIHSLQFKPLMNDGQYTFDDFYNAKVGQIGTLTQRENSAFETQKNIVDQLKNTREGISGVNLDEEASKMIEFQKSFEASARIIKMADEMFDTVLSLKRM